MERFCSHALWGFCWAFDRNSSSSFLTFPCLRFLAHFLLHLLPTSRGYITPAIYCNASGPYQGSSFPLFVIHFDTVLVKDVVRSSGLGVNLLIFESFVKLPFAFPVGVVDIYVRCQLLLLMFCLCCTFLACFVQHFIVFSISCFIASGFSFVFSDFEPASALSLIPSVYIAVSFPITQLLRATSLCPWRRWLQDLFLAADLPPWR